MYIDYDTAESILCTQNYARLQGCNLVFDLRSMLMRARHARMLDPGWSRVVDSFLTAWRGTRARSTVLFVFALLRERCCCSTSSSTPPIWLRGAVLLCAGASRSCY